MSLPEFLARVVGIIEGAGVPYMLTGSLAAAYYATPRATQDVDLVIDTTEERVRTLVEGLQAVGCYVDIDAALQAWRSRGQFNAIDPDRGWKVDLIVRRDRPFSVQEFGRRAAASVLGVELFLASVEDVILSKLEWARLGDSELQRRDVLQLVERRRGELDLGYIERWTDALGVRDEWDEVLRRLSEKG